MRILPLARVVVNRFLAADSVRSHAFGNRTVPDAEPSGCLGCTDCFAVEQNDLRRACVIRLLSSRSPSAVFWLVIPISIRKSIQRKTTRTLAHVFKEIFELLPSIANRYACAAIFTIAGMAYVGATLVHRSPTCICLCLRHTVYSARITTISVFGSLASARFSQPSSHITLRRKEFLSAFASDIRTILEQMFSALDFHRFSDNGKPSVFFTNSNRLSCWHRYFYLGV